MIQGHEEGKLLPFVVILTPSGSGKTQLPFALEAKGRPVHHLVLNETGCNKQVIYKAMEDISKTFRMALESDIDILNHRFQKRNVKIQDSMAFTCISILNRKIELQIVSVIFTMLGANYHSHLLPKSMSEYTVDALKQHVALMKQVLGPAQLPIFFLDEVNTDCDRRKAGLRLARNILRSVGLVAVILTTDSGACCLIGYSGSGRFDAEPLLWCKVITRLPKLTPTTAALIGLDVALHTIDKWYGSFVAFIKTHCFTCLPYFMHMLTDVLNKLTGRGEGETDVLPRLTTAAFMDRVFLEMNKTIRHANPKRQPIHVLQSQLGLYLSFYNNCDFHNAHVPVNMFDDDEYVDILISHHFAQLVEDQVFDVYLDGLPGIEHVDAALYHLCIQAADGRLVTWKRRAVFPSPCEDPFVILIFLTLPYSDKCEEQEVMYPTANARQGPNLIDTGIYSEMRSSRLCHDGDTRRTKVALAATAFAHASRVDGFCGTTLSRFLLHLAVELCPFPKVVAEFKWSENSVVTSSAAFNERFKDLRVPFLGPPNTIFPSNLLALEGGMFANLQTLANIANNMHFKIAGNESGKWKLDFSGNIVNRVTLKALKDTLLQVANNSGQTFGGVHIYFTAFLQRNLFATESWNDWKEGKGLKTVNVAKLTFGKKCDIDLLPLAGRNMPWIDWDECTLLVIFIDVTSFIKREIL
jgi:hypothetical protein